MGINNKFDTLLSEGIKKATAPVAKPAVKYRAYFIAYKNGKNRKVKGNFSIKGDKLIGVEVIKEMQVRGKVEYLTCETIIDIKGATVTSRG